MTTQQKATVGFIGLGTMGREMVINLLKAGYVVHAHDVRRDAGHGPVGTNGAVDAAGKYALRALAQRPSVAVIHGPRSARAP